MAHSGSHNEDYHLKKMFEHHQCLMNEHHKTTVVMYKCKLTGRMIVGGGRRVQERLEYLLENDIQLKNAILDDEDDMNRCQRQQDYIGGPAHQAFNRLRAKHHPPKKLPFPVKYLEDREADNYIRQYIKDKYFASGGTKKRIEWTEEFKPEEWPEHIIRFSSIKKSFQSYKASEFEALGFHKKKVEVMKDIIIHLLQAEGIDANTHVDPYMDKEKFALKQRIRGERNVPLVTSSSTSSSGSSLSSNASLSQYFNNPPSLPANNQRVRANLQRFLMANQPASGVPSSSGPTPPLPPPPPPSMTPSAPLPPLFTSHSLIRKV